MKVRKLSIDFFTYKTIVYIAGGIIPVNIIFFDILTKTSERVCIYFIKNDTRRKIKGINNTEIYVKFKVYDTCVSGLVVQEVHG